MFDKDSRIHGSIIDFNGERFGMKHFSLCSTVLVLSFPGGALAENAPDDRVFDQRWYLGAGLGVSHVDPDPGSAFNRVVDDSDTGKAIFLGKDLSKRWSVDVYAADLGEAQVTIGSSSAEPIEYMHYGISAIGYFYNNRRALDYSDGHEDEGLYRREGFSLFGRVGVGVMNNSSPIDYRQRNETHLLGGLGIEYGWSNGFAMRAELASYDEDSKFFSLSILKRFGNAEPYPRIALVTPEPEPEVMPVVKEMTWPTLYFEYNRSDLTEAEKQKLYDFASRYISRQDRTFEIHGHADSVGSDLYNQRLSEHRANSVLQHLETLNVDTKGLKSIGHGESRPTADNSTPEGRQQNRRVELIEIQGAN